MATYDADSLAARILRDAKVPKGSTYATTTTILGMADDELRSLVLPHVQHASGDYLAYTLDVPLVVGKRAYRLPARAFRLKSVRRFGSDGKERPFSALDSEQTYEHEGRGKHYFLEANAVVPLLEPGAEGGFLRFRYYRMPNRLVSTALCALVTGAAVEGVVMVSSTVPLGPVGGTVLVDVVKGSPGFESLGDGVPAAVVSATELQLPADVATEVEGGDAVCPEGTSCFPQLPLVFHDVVVERVVARVLREQKDNAGAQMAMASAATKEAAALSVVSPRNEDGRPVVNRTWF